MAWTKHESTLATGAVVLRAIGAAAIVTISVMTSLGHCAEVVPDRSMRLPTGPVPPKIGLEKTYGVILAGDGSLWSWGENDLGWPVLGLGRITNQPTLRRIGVENDWVDIAMGWSHTLALKKDGTLWGWGQNVHSQLGFSSSGRSSRRNVPTPSVPGNNWKQIAAGGSHSVAIKQDGTLWAWGDNWAGQLGIGTTVEETSEAIQVGSATNWTKVWAGILETVALQSDGTLWYWGDNPNPTVPQTGAGASNIFAPMRISAATNWVDVGFGPWSVIAVQTDGTLWCWGRHAHEFTGVGDHDLDATPVRVGSNSNWQEICPAGWSFHVLRKKDGSLWEMLAQMGQPLRVTRLELKKEVVAFAARGNALRPMGVVLTREGEVWTWGKVLAEWTHMDGREPEPVIRRTPWQLPSPGRTCLANRALHSISSAGRCGGGAGMGCQFRRVVNAVPPMLNQPRAADYEVHAPAGFLRSFEFFPMSGPEISSQCDDPMDLLFDVYELKAHQRSGYDHPGCWCAAAFGHGVLYGKPSADRDDSGFVPRPISR